jgi:hypothetical protein
MNKNQTFDGNNTAFGLDLDEVRQTASRQLLASLVVGVLVLASAALMAVRPSHQDSAGVAQQRFTAVQQPMFVTQQTQRVAGLARHGMELP